MFKSGTDFRCFSEIEVTISENGSHSIQSCKHEITKDIPENPEIKMVVDRYLGKTERFVFNPFPPRGSPLTSKIVWR